MKVHGTIRKVLKSLALAAAVALAGFVAYATMPADVKGDDDHEAPDVVREIEIVKIISACAQRDPHDGNILLSAGLDVASRTGVTFVSAHPSPNRGTGGPHPL